MASSDSNILPPAPIREVLVNRDGSMTQPWVGYFQKIAARVGGPASVTVQQLATDLDTAETNITALQAHVVTIDAHLVTIDGQLVTQAAEIAAIQAQLAPGISATITTAQLTPLGSQGSMTFIDGVLTAQVQAT
jgi:hypothetical protein